MDPTLTQSPTPPADARLVISERIGSSQAAAAASRTSWGIGSRSIMSWCGMREWG